MPPVRVKTPEVVVVGGGAVGACTALELATRGVETLLVERGPALAAGCSAGSAGLICPSHSAPIANPAALRDGLRWMWQPESPFSMRPRPELIPWLARFVAASRAARAGRGASLLRELSLASLRLHRELAGRHGTGLVERGTLSVYETPEAFAADAGEATASGLAHRVLAADDARAFEPALGERVAGAVFHPEEAHCEPREFVLAVGRAAEAAGANIRTSLDLRRLAVRDGRIALDTADGFLRPKAVVVAAGVWSGRLLRSAGLYVPLEGGKGYHVDVERGAGDAGVPLFIAERRVILTPFERCIRLAGTLELAGLDLTISTRRAGAVRSAATAFAPSLAGRRTLEVWSGLRPCTPDGLPVIGRAETADGLFVATGHAMKGVALAPITGRLVAQLCTGETPERDLEPFRLERFKALFPSLSRRFA